MRPWLVIVGVAFLLVGGGALLALLLAPAPSVTQQSTSQLDGQFTPASSTASATIPAANAARGTLVLHWSSTIPVAVDLLVPCAPSLFGCVSGPSLASWPANASGSFSFAGSLNREYVLSWATPAGEPATFTFSAVARWTVQSSPPAADAIAEVASGLLAGVGAVALFLGLFLRGGFQRPPRVVSRTADDAAEVARATDPRTGTSAGGSGRLPPGPPSRSG
ncbi:MAG: hypothetical protein L3J86_00665 [Thermoplasmata archaeon]|nr:hypothetical protein [Thermoplasmata archaeon]